MTPTYTKQHIIELVKDYLRTFNHPSHVVADGLSLKDFELIGIIDMAVKERPVSAPMLGARVGRTYERPAVNA